MGNTDVPLDAQGSTGHICTKLEAVKGALVSLVNEWPTTRTLSLIGFGDSALCHATRLAHGQDEVFRKAVNSLCGMGTSDLAVALRDASSHLLAVAPQAVKKVLLVQGSEVRRSGAAVLIAEELATRGVSIDVITIGEDSSRLFAQQLAGCGNGRSWLAVTGSDVAKAVEEFSRSISAMVVSGMSIALQLDDGWGVRGCVRCASEHLPLFCALGETPRELKINVGGLGAADPMDLWFFLDRMNPENQSPLLGGTVHMACGGTTERVVYSFPGTEDDRQATPSASDLRAMVVASASIRLKLAEATLCMAERRDDLASMKAVKAALQAMQVDSDVVGDEPLRQMVGRLGRQFDQQGALDKKLLNDLAARTSSLPTARLPNSTTARTSSYAAPPKQDSVASAQAVDAPTRTQETSDQASSVSGQSPPLQTYAPCGAGLDSTAMHMLNVCRASLETHTRLVSLLGDFTDMDRGDNEQHATHLAIATPHKWVDQICGARVKSLVDLEAGVHDLRLKIQSLITHAETLRAQVREREHMKDIVVMAISCIQFYQWKDAGWIATLKTLRARGTMLREVLQEP